MARRASLSRHANAEPGMKRLLVATDLSARSDRALERAFSLARDLGADLTILYVVDEDLPAAMAEELETAAKRSLQQCVDSLAAAAQPAPDASIKVVSGRPYSDIIEISEAERADMIVLGMHRENAFKDMFRGTTVERVLRAGHLPVLLVKDRAGSPYRRILVGVDFSVCSKKAIEFAVAFAPDAEFHLVHAYDIPFKGFGFSHGTRRAASKSHETQFRAMVDEELAKFVSSLDAQPPNIRPVMEEGIATDVLHRQIAHLKPDLLVIGTHGRTGITHAILGSVAEELLRDPPCDVLAVKAW